MPLFTPFETCPAAEMRVRTFLASFAPRFQRHRPLRPSQPDGFSADGEFEEDLFDETLSRSVQEVRGGSGALSVPCVDHNQLLLVDHVPASDG